MSFDDELNNLKKLFKSNLSKDNKQILVWATVDSVNWEDKTMTAIDGDGVKFYNVLLGLDSFVAKPVVNTDCLLLIIEGDQTSSLMIHCNESELFQWNGGELGGLINIEPLVEKLNNLKDEVNAFKDKYNAHIHVTTATIGATPTVGVLSPTTSSASAVSAFDRDDFEDTKIKH